MDVIKKRFSGLLLSLSRIWIFKWRDAVNFMEQKAGVQDSTQLQGLPEAVKELEACEEELYALLPKLDSAAKVCAAVSDSDRRHDTSAEAGGCGQCKGARICPAASCEG